MSDDAPLHTLHYSSAFEPTLLNALADLIDLPISVFLALILEYLRTLKNAFTNFDQALIGLVPTDLKAEGTTLLNNMTVAFNTAIAAHDSSYWIWSNESVVGRGTGYLAKAGEYVPQGVTSYIKTTKDAESESPNRRSSRAEPEQDDEIASTTTDLTELSTTAQAGSLTSSEIFSPPSSDIASAWDNDDAESNASPFMHDYYTSARIPSPPQINLAPHMQPLAGGEAEHGGVRLCDERAKGVRSPAYNNTGPSARFTPYSEDEYPSDGAKEDVEPGGTTKKLVKAIDQRVDEAGSGLGGGGEGYDARSLGSERRDGS
ncbi:hypothetical protein C8R44DRAFT_740676 [Mycena epipterygia]|nr:hypothetical protein C8R44DRAFT_740676 [Mycena epipterygia]